MLRKLTVLLLLAASVSGCARYTSQVVPFRPPQAYENHQSFGGVTVAAEAFADNESAEKAFGFDIKGSGKLLPVQLVLTNDGGEKLQVVGSQTFLVDDEGNYWPVIPNGTAIDRLQKSTELSSFFGKGAGKGALLGATAGTIVGATIGIVSGRGVGEAIGKGAVIGAAGGGLIGATKEGTSGERERTILDDIRDKGLEGKQIPPQALAHGFLFFPGEAQSAKELRVQFREIGTGNLHSVVLRFPPPAKPAK